MEGIKLLDTIIRCLYHVSVYLLEIRSAVNVLIFCVVSNALISPIFVNKDEN